VTEARLIMLALGCFLLTWGISLFARAAADRWVKRPLGAVVRRRAIRLGLIAVPFGIAWAAAGVLLDRALTGRPLGHDLGGQATLGAIGVLVLGAGLAIAGWWFDRSRGRERCPSCWFDLEAAVKTNEQDELREILCTECGRTVSRWKDLYTTRRNLPLLWCAAACVPLAYGVIATPRAIESGVRGLVPTSVLIAGFERLPTSFVTDPQPQSSSLLERVVRSELWDWQSHWLSARAQSLRNNPRTLADLRITDDFAWYGWTTSRHSGLLLSGLQSGDSEDVTYARHYLNRLIGDMYWDLRSSPLAGREEEVMKFWQDPQADHWRWWLIAQCGIAMERWWPEIDMNVRTTTAMLAQQHQLVAAAALAHHFEGARQTLDWLVSGPSALMGENTWQVIEQAGHIELAARLRKREQLQNVVGNSESDRAEQFAAARRVAELGPSMRSYVSISYMMLRAGWTAEELDELRALRERVRYKLLE
jgi:hypothetical protein